MCRSRLDNGQPWEGGEYTAQCGATCGDSVVHEGEICDDGNDSNDDQCLTTCHSHRCGDGIERDDLQPGDEGYESCDDGNGDPFDGCGNFCNRCGDGVRGAFEACDDGNDIDNDGCTACGLDSCGNGQVDQGEVCDDGNDNNADSCRLGCTQSCEELGDTIEFGHHYSVHNEEETWAAAQADCERRCGHLIVVNSQAEFEFYQKFRVFS